MNRSIRLSVLWLLLWAEATTMQLVEGLFGCSGPGLRGSGIRLEGIRERVQFGYGAGRFAAALAHVAVCLRRDLSNNQISTIATGAFAQLTALTGLYGAG
jgi:hypothetical protein